ncbi:hypothetical protein LCGC14_2375080, partial [marine sediment metagenome]
MPDTTDAHLVTAVLEGDHAAYKELVARYQGHVYGLAYSLIGNWTDAQDVTQETFIRAYSNLDQLRDAGRFAAWLRRVAFSVAMNWMKAFRPKIWQQLDGLDLDRLEIDFQPGPPEVLARRELADAVLAAIASLPPKYRVPLTMFHLDGLSYKKVADFLDIPLGAVKGLIHRARKQLKAALPAAIAGKMAPTVQEVFNEHKLPPAFSRDVWNLCMDWLCAGGPGGFPADPERQKNIALAAARDPDVARVNEWRSQAEPLPEWALEVDADTPQWGVEMHSHAWVAHLERQVWMIAHDTSLPNEGPARCGSVTASRLQWSALVVRALVQWLDGEPASDQVPLAGEIHRLLGKNDDEKAGAVQLLRDTIRIAAEGPAEGFDEAFKALPVASDLARDMRGAMEQVEFMWGYRWETMVLGLCRAIGDGQCRGSKPRAWHVGEYGRMCLAHRDDPARVPATCAILLGLWAWLTDAPAET